MRIKIDMAEIEEIVENYLAAKFYQDPDEVMCVEWIDTDGDSVGLDGYHVEIEIGKTESEAEVLYDEYGSGGDVALKF